MERDDEHGVPPGQVTPANAGPRERPAPWSQPPVLSVVGWAVSLAIGAWLLWSAAGKLLGADTAAEELTRLGQPAGSWPAIGAAQALGVTAYLHPRTAVVGAVLITAYMGGGAALHLQAGDGVLTPVGAGVGAWLGLVLRDPHVRAVAPWRQRGDTPRVGRASSRVVGP